MAKKNTTRTRLIERAAKRGRLAAAGPVRKPARSGDQPRVAKASGPGTTDLEIPGLQAGDIQDTVRSVVTYVQQNPLAAAAVAIGVGVMLTSMYWDKPAATRGKRRTAT